MDIVTTDVVGSELLVFVWYTTFCSAPEVAIEDGVDDEDTEKGTICCCNC